ncbi:MAG: CRISPR-associated endonuclease Cas1 [Saprospiraceae bacterium]|nr:CRISPR-associated endonuclease Cas1 [Saprospiraceae bacterium]
MQLHLNTYGTYLHIKDQLFEIRIKGEAEKHQIAPGKVKSIWIGQGIALSSEAVKTAVQHNIDIVFLEYTGQPLARIWHSKLGSTSLIRKKQLEASLGRLGLSHVKNWLGQKVENQLNFIQNLRKHRKLHQAYLDKKIIHLQALLTSIQQIEAETVDQVADRLRGWEGTAGRLYFATLSYVLPIQYQFRGRSHRPAQDAFNAFLNYAYGVLYSRTERVLILAGLDPYVGFLHRDDYNYKSMVYDFIEPYRIMADKTVFQLFSAKKVRQDQVDIIANGVRLNKSGKELLMQHFNIALEEQKVRYRGRNQTRAQIMQFAAHQFANSLLADL